MDTNTRADFFDCRSDLAVVRMWTGFPGPAVLTYRGIIVDPAAPNGRAAVTNAFELVVR